MDASSYRGKRPNRQISQGQGVHRPMILIALGANRAGHWGAPAATLARAVDEIAKARLRVHAVSALYETAPVGAGPQGAYVNAVAIVTSPRAAFALLRVLKRLEHRAGPRSERRWGPRALDLDILDDGRVVCGWRGGRAMPHAGPGRLVLPHPLMHTRPFVLRPLLDVAPDWRHPVLQRSAVELWARVKGRREGRVLQRVGGLKSAG